MKLGRVQAIAIVIASAALLAVSTMVFIVGEHEQVVITQFGAPTGEPITSPGLKFKLPIQVANRFEKRFLEWDGSSNEFPTRDKRFIYVDTYARWRIVDPLLYLQRVGNETIAQSRIRQILDGATRSTIANHDLIEVVRTTNREFAVSDDLAPLLPLLAEGEIADPSAAVTSRAFKRVEVGRAELEATALKLSQGSAATLGIEVLDLRFKRISYTEGVKNDVYTRMISERQRIAAQFRSEGEGAAARIGGERERELKRILSEGYRDAEVIRGRADAEAARIYADAYNGDPEFYKFLKSMEVLAEVLRKDAMLVLDTDSEVLQYLERSK
jgi:membrane protease subunit HflC